jgi:hypothetical protein
VIAIDKCRNIFTNPCETDITRLWRGDGVVQDMVLEEQVTFSSTKMVAGVVELSKTLTQK